MSAIAASGHVNTSAEHATRSAHFPGSSEPSLASWRAAYAFQTVNARTASPRVMRCSGCQPGSGPVRGRRVTAAWIPWNGFGSSTGKSEPPAMTAGRQQRAPRVGAGGAARDRAAREPRACRRCSAWAACSGARPGARKRGMSRSARIWACSTRLAMVRGAPPGGAAGQRTLEGVEDERVRPVADRVDADLETPGAAARARASSSSGGSSRSPVFAGSSQYGAWSAAPREPSAPSAISFTAPTHAPVRRRSVSGPRRGRLPGESGRRPERDVVPEGELAGGDQPPVGGEGVEVGAHLVDAGEARRRGSRRGGLRTASGRTGRSSDGLGAAARAPARCR